MASSSEIFHLSTGQSDADIKTAFEAAMTALAPGATDKVFIINKDSVVLLGKVTTA